MHVHVWGVCVLVLRWVGDSIKGSVRSGAGKFVSVRDGKGSLVLNFHGRVAVEKLTGTIKKC